MLEKFPAETCHEDFKDPLTDEHSRKGRDREWGGERAREGKGRKTRAFERQRNVVMRRRGKKE